MATLQAGQTVSIQLAEGESYTVTPSGTAQVSTRGVSGSELSAPRTLTSAQTFGPYTEAGAISIACLGGTVDYTQAGGPVYQDPTTGALVGAGGGLVSPRQSAALHRFWGLRSGVAANSALLQTRLIKLVAEQPFNEVRLHLMHYGTSAPTWKAAFAATETADTSTQANMAQPVVGGTAYNVIDSTSDVFGWRTALWAGASTKAFAGTGSVSATDSVAEMVSSDWTPCQSVPRSDGGAGFMLMVQAYCTDANTQNASWVSATGIAAARTPTVANRGRILQLSRGANDNIATPASTTFALVEDTIPVMVEVRYRTNAMTVMQFGDSLFQNDALVADKVSCALARACADVSTATGRAVVSCNTAGSSMGSANFWREAQKVLLLHKPAAAIYACFTPNDQPYGSAGALRYKLQLQEGRVAEFIARCRADGIVPILDTGVPYFAGLDATTDLIRKDYLSVIRGVAAATGAILIDSDAFFSDGANRANIRSPYNQGDNIHYNEAGVEAKAVELIAPALRRALGI